MAATKHKTATARVHNWSPAKGAPRKAANRKRTTKKRAASKGRRKKGKKRNPSTALAVSPKVVEIVKYRNRKNGSAVAGKKRNGATRTKRNPNAGGGALSQFKLKGNPSLEGATNVAKIALIGFGGGLLARTNSAVALALVRRFGGAQGGSLANHPVAKPVVTALAAWFLVPREMGWMGVRSEQSKKVAQVGGILFAAADAVDIFFEGVNSIPDRLAAIVGGNGAVQTNPKTAIATRAATAAAQGAADAGYSDEQIEAAARAAAQGTLQGLEGVPGVNDIALEDLGWLA